MSFPTLNIGDLIAKTPIVQGGMVFLFPGSLPPWPTKAASVSSPEP